MISNNTDDISIIGYSTLASLTSLLLAQKDVSHRFFIEDLPKNLPPIANPLTNRATQLLEQPFISTDILAKIFYMEKYDFHWYDNQEKEYLHLNDYYKFPIYALDNRIRHHCFIDCLQKNGNVDLIKSNNIQHELYATNSNINIIGGGKLSSFFDELKLTAEFEFPIKRTLFLFNIKCDEKLLRKYKDVKMLCFSGSGEVVLYPFLHVSRENALNLVVNIVENGNWDYIRELPNKETVFQKILTELVKTNKELAIDLLNCELLDENHFSKTQILPYFKDPIKKINGQLFLGVGEAIYKVDPVTGQGYNTGVEMANRIMNFSENHYSYAQQKTEELLHLNYLFTQASKDYVGKVYASASNNKPLRDFIISAFENISLFFPWLINEKESKKLLAHYTKKHYFWGS